MLELRQIESFYPENLRHFKRNLLREYLQYKVLDAVFTSREGQKLVFMGGTAIHIAHGLPRFSEDLDFDNMGLAEDSFTSLADIIAKKLGKEGYAVETKTSFKGAFSADIKIVKALYDENISGHPGEKILIKLDAEPQRFEYRPDRIIINKFDVLMGINVVPADILLSQKYYAILNRKRAMGRDLYDALFLAGKTAPNFKYLKERAGIDGVADLKRALLERSAKLDLKLLARDLEQFIFSADDAKRVMLFEEYVRGW